MDYEAEFLGNVDMFTGLFGQDDFASSPSRGEQKNHANIENVLVEKLGDYGVDASPEGDADFQDALFDSEWMTEKIDLTSLAAELHSNFTFENICTESQEPFVADEDDSCSVEEVDVMDTSTDVEDPIPLLPEQHVPDVESIADFKSLLELYLNAARRSSQDVGPLAAHAEDDVFLADSPLPTKSLSKGNMSEPATPSPKGKVKTPEQKQRKRLQNRNAATRYRSKKRSEQEILNAKCKELEDQNAKLRKRVESKQQEVKYLKELIIDVFNRKPAKK